jgi:spore coat-associated protein N
MRRILFPLLVIGLAAGLFSLGSGAFFSDTETDTGNTITAGTLDLVCEAGASACGSSHFDIDDAAPGGAAQALSVTLSNGGTLAGPLAVKIEATSVADTCAAEACNGMADLLASEIDVTACTYDGANCTTLAGWPGVINSLDDIVGTCRTLDADFQPADDNKVFSISVRINLGVANNRQGDGMSIDLKFGLAQAGQAAFCE